jgi:tRNA-dihydrouridine synthase B
VIRVSALQIGSIAVADPVILAPMAGVTDLPFRQLAREFGVGLAVTEMVASEPLVRERADMRRKISRPESTPFVVQLAGREARWMAEGARIAVDEGADVIDINMGCPSKMVTNGASGSALMRDLDHALTLVDAVVKAVAVPVTLKMRLGWDFDCLNAPELAARAEAAGVKMVTVHGRTRNQFFKDRANWSLVAAVKAAVRIPVVVNGDITSLQSARTALAQSGADAVMVGRGAFGRPWLPGRIARALRGADLGEPALSVKLTTMSHHFAAMVEHYGPHLGLRNMRKHFCWYLEDVLDPHADGADAMKQWRRRLCETDDQALIVQALDQLADAVQASAVHKERAA